MKSTRQNIILQIISEQEIETQNQLMDVLAQHGVSSTQATLSRDIKELHLTKTLSPSGKYRYSAPAADEFPGYDERLKKIFRECVTSYAEAQNIIVIKTLPGLASAACAASGKSPSSMTTACSLSPTANPSPAPKYRCPAVVPR